MSKDKYMLITRTMRGYVNIPEVQNIITDDNLIQFSEINKNTKFTIIRFDLYTKRVLVNCKYGNKEFSALFSYDFIMNNCIILGEDKNTIIEGLYLQVPDDKIKLTKYEFVRNILGGILCGILLGILI